MEKTIEIPEGYEAALERCKQWVAGTSGLNPGASPKEVAEYLFPELAESEDERIRKFIAETIFYCYGDSQEYLDTIAYLERQKEPHFTKRNALFDKCVENCDTAVMKEVSESIDKILEKEQKPAEWSEEDEEIIKSLITDVECCEIDGHIGGAEAERKIAWLKSLRPSWKPSEEQRHIEGQDTCYLNKQSLVTFIEDCIAENLENTTDANHDNHEGYHQACWDIIYRINQMCK